MPESIAEHGDQVQSFLGYDLHVSKKDEKITYIVQTASPHIDLSIICKSKGMIVSTCNLDNFYRRQKLNRFESFLWACRYALKPEFVM